MALVVKDRINETTTTTGTGTVTLAGAVTGFQTFAAVGDGSTTYYAITNGNAWEVGLGTYTTSGTTLSRTTILESSNAGAALTLSGTSNVFCTYPAEKAVTLNGTVINDANVVATANIVDDAVTADKLADAINTAISDNTAKVTNATHTGDVTGATTLTIGTDKVLTSMILDANVTAGKLATDSVTTVKILDANITTAKLASSVPLGAKNLIINGAMQISQRATTSTGITGSGYYTVDRWRTVAGTVGTWTASQDTDAPDGFGSSLKMQCTTANASLSAGSYLFLNHIIEAQNLQQLSYGSAAAETMTISFWVKSNKTGVYSIYLSQPDSSTRMLTKTITISSADTWEKKSLTIPGDTSGQIDNNNGSGLNLWIALGAGSNKTSGTINNTWATYDQTDEVDSSNVNLADSITNYINITGVQLEEGSTATAFEHRMYGQELQMCQRYYEAGAGRVYGSSDATLNIVSEETFKVTKRATPTMTNTSWTYARNGASGSVSVVNYETNTNKHSRYGNIGAAWVVGHFSGAWTSNAEL